MQPGVPEGTRSPGSPQTCTAGRWPLLYGLHRQPVGRTGRRRTEGAEPVAGIELPALQGDGDSGERGHERRARPRNDDRPRTQARNARLPARLPGHRAGPVPAESRGVRHPSRETPGTRRFRDWVATASVQSSAIPTAREEPQIRRIDAAALPPARKWQNSSGNQRRTGASDIPTGTQRTWIQSDEARPGRSTVTQGGAQRRREHKRAQPRAGTKKPTTSGASTGAGRGNNQPQDGGAAWKQERSELRGTSREGHTIVRETRTERASRRQGRPSAVGRPHLRGVLDAIALPFRGSARRSKNSRMPTTLRSQQSGAARERPWGRRSA